MWKPDWRLFVADVVIDIDVDDLFKQVMATNQVQGTVQQRAARIAARARQITLAEGGSANITVEQYHMANGRASYNVISDSPDEEYGTAAGVRLRALRRAAREVK